MKSGGVTSVPGRSYTTDDLLQIYGDEQGQRYAFVGETHVPLILGLTYLASNLVLNSLNIFWFGKMVQTIRSRFDPPIGTKGLKSAKEVHYEPVEKTEKVKQNEAREAIERAKREGRAAYAASPMKAEKKPGSITAARERAEAVMGAPVAVDAAAELQRATFTDVNSSAEIEGKRTLRTRRKA